VAKKLKQVSKLKEPHSILKNTEEMIRPEAILIFERSPQLIRKKTFSTTRHQKLSPIFSLLVPVSASQAIGNVAAESISS
jgi:hypothetical protein